MRSTRRRFEAVIVANQNIILAIIESFFENACCLFFLIAFEKIKDNAAAIIDSTNHETRLILSIN
jgi:hypothetical protein